MKFEVEIRNESEILLVINPIKNEIYQSVAESKKEFQRRVINKILARELGISSYAHKNSGAPFIPEDDKLTISISHSGDLVCLYLSTGKIIGVDLQCMTRPIEKLASHFVNTIENELIERTKINYYIIWCAKEAFYKLKEGYIADLKENVCIKKIDSASVEFEFENHLVEFRHLIFDNYCLVFS